MGVCGTAGGEQSICADKVSRSGVAWGVRGARVWGGIVSYPRLSLPREGRRRLGRAGDSDAPPTRAVSGGTAVVPSQWWDCSRNAVGLGRLSLMRDERYRIVSFITHQPQRSGPRAPVPDYGARVRRQEEARQQGDGVKTELKRLQRQLAGVTGAKDAEIERLETRVATLEVTLRSRNAEAAALQVPANRRQEFGCRHLRSFSGPHIYRRPQPCRSSQRIREREGRGGARGLCLGALKRGQRGAATPLPLTYVPKQRGGSALRGARGRPGVFA